MSELRDSKQYPFSYFGHGTSRVSDQLEIWVCFERQLEAPEQKPIESSAPEPFTEFSWHDTLLAISTDLDVKYAIQDYDPKHLDWLPDDPEQLSNETVIERIKNEVMDQNKDANDPGRTAWDRFDRDVDQWILKLHATVPLRFVVKNVRLPKNHVSRWHSWSVAGVPLLYPELSELLRGTARPLEVGHVISLMIGYYLSECPARKWSTREKAFVLDLPIESVAQSAHLAEIVSSYPAKERTSILIRLLEKKHLAALFVMFESKMQPYLLDDDIFRQVKSLVESFHLPDDVIGLIAKRTGLNAPQYLPAEERRKKIKSKWIPWGLRMIELVRMKPMNPYERKELDEMEAALKSG